MINPHRVGQLLTNLISEQFSSHRYTPAYDARDEDVAKNLYEHIESIFQSTHYSFETEHTIDFTHDINQQKSEVEEEIDSDDTESDESSMEVEENQKNNSFHRFSILYMKKAVDFYDERDANTGRKKHTWKSFQHRFPNVKNRNYIQRFRKYLESGGTKQQKLDEIDRYTYVKVVQARSEFLLIHDIHIKRWALLKAKELNDNTFSASDNWVNRFKQRHSLCSRKVTKLVTQREVVDSDIIHESSDIYVNKIQRLLPHYHQRNVLNTDQSGLEIEMVGNRTISFKGEKSTFGKVRSVYNTSHSYTVQFIISLSGQLTGPCFLCLKEPNGYMSANIKKNLFDALNVVVTCSKSGKLTTSLVQYWIEQVLEPTIGDKKVLLLSDSWGGQTDPQLYMTMKHLRVETIPKKTTAMIQPLDITINRQYKHIVRTVYDHVRLYGIDCNISQRNNIIKLTSLSYNQMCSNKFVPMIRYSWFRGGYLLKDPGSFSER